MVRDDEVREIGGEEEARRLRESYRRLEEMSGVRFGQAFFENVAKQRRRLDSDPGARALVAFRRLAPDRSELEFAHALLRANFWDGGDPSSDEFYRGLAVQLGLDPEAFVETMHTDEARDGALYDFALARPLGRRLGAGAARRLYLQTREGCPHLIGKACSRLERVQANIGAAMQ